MTTARPIGVPSIDVSRVASPRDGAARAAAAAIAAFDITVELRETIDISV